MRPRNSGLQRWPFLNVVAQGTFLAAYYFVVVPAVLIILSVPVSHVILITAAGLGISVSLLAAILAIVFLAANKRVRAVQKGLIAGHAICANCNQPYSEHGTRCECPLGVANRKAGVTFTPISREDQGAQNFLDDLAGKTPTIGKCFNCEKEVGEGEYCHGCKAFVCDECDQRALSGRMGAHPKEDHLIGEDEDDDDID